MCLFGLVSSLNGLSLASGRAILEMGRARICRRFSGGFMPRNHTPANALIFNFVVGTIALLVLDTGKLITWSALGAVMIYVLVDPGPHRPAAQASAPGATVPHALLSLSARGFFHPGRRLFRRDADR